MKNIVRSTERRNYADGMSTEKDVLARYLQAQRNALLWKLDGLGERDLRWPMTPTGTNLLGLVKHAASVEAGYFGEVFDRPFPETFPWEDDPDDNADMWAKASESSEWITDLYRRVWAHADRTIDSLDLDAPGIVPWWRADRQSVTLHHILVHVIVDISRHAGHADIVRETFDGAIGMTATNPNVPDLGTAGWEEYRAMLKETANRFE